MHPPFLLWCWIHSYLLRAHNVEKKFLKLQLVAKIPNIILSLHEETGMLLRYQKPRKVLHFCPLLFFGYLLYMLKTGIPYDTTKTSTNH
jgi:hypothetical protein